MMESNQRIKYLRIFSLLLVLTLTIGLLYLGNQIEKLGAYGYPGIFLFSLLANATIILPLPSVVMTSVLGTMLNPFWVAIFAGTGAAIGELSGYLAGFSGQKVLEKNRYNERLVGWMQKYGSITILVLAIIPNPAFDIAGIMAGALRLPVHKFLFWCVIGKIIKMFIFAYGGSYLHQFYRYFQN